ncbi:Non-specific serine/threonine protein kinase [Micromonospora noduli]|uniref:Non-specific serine/threonine protein kinase n=1 Tax=Micromonospora noduli TaxID=709876 RepID=A0A328N7K3_9ACTN|nr:serine/threonine-protein kinase [Micromonospora noduli]RAO04465.1 Non-specific serine/threonine protein kinase [Micromonospora noduli]RAO27557.1 Non-specific serine/threonine protein kinase [Micromonospora noduli]
MSELAGPPVPGLAKLWTHDPVTAGPYRLVGRLGAGGQGVVYLGEDDAGDRVAVKMVNVDLSDPRARSQFVKEIAAARRVAPFCTAQVLFAEVDGERPYVVSEFIEGLTLHRHVRERGPVTGNALHRLAVGTVTALAAIHSAGVVHCDLKPDNVVLGQDGPRVIDFGIARALGNTETASSRVMGTTAYMAPERFRNDAIGPQCDVFAWAATIAFAAGGRPPFGSDSLFAVMHRVLHDPPDLPAMPPVLDELIRECLAKDPADRPAAERVLVRLLRQDGRVTEPLRRESLLEVGNETAGAPTPDHPLPQVTPTTPPPGATQSQVPARPTVPTQARPAQPAHLPVQTQPAHLPATEPGVGAEGGGALRRLRREAPDAWGISTALFLGSVGAAAGYVASSAVGPAAAVGAVAFVVVYLVRLLVATALGRRSDRG